MKSISLGDLQTNPERYQEIAVVLEEGGLICFPAPSGYKLAADLSSPSAITQMLQAKRRVKNAPALVFIPESKWMEQVAASVSEQAWRLIEAFWPGPLTLLVEASEELDPKVRKPLTKAKGWIGVRMPDDEVSRAVLTTFGRPLLVSSANLAQKRGATSVAQVRKNFGRTVEVMIDAGDLKDGPKSTLVDVSQLEPQVIRAEAVAAEEVARILAG